MVPQVEGIRHLPVMVEEVVGLLVQNPGGIYLDATVGQGGHAEEILKKLSKDGLIIGMDRDREALMAVAGRIKDERLRLVHGSFSEMEDVVGSFDIPKLNGVLMDLGVSMVQIKDYERGFSFHSDAPLDMRMDTCLGLTAQEIVNTWSRKELERIFREYGEERRGGRIAEEIVRERRRKRINSCRELSDIVVRVSGMRGRIHPATRVFQALRIAVNDELGELKKGLEAAVNLLAHTGRLCVITYHSLEDRIVKNKFRDWEREGVVKRLNKKPLRPTEKEQRRNPASRSAKLRGVERL
ncbi:MAG: 16S rRNA (cytosine(1402)-N(4))-methyltransferase RsmH [Nitrospirae bacterium]|nr:MAG: 16S rRNA (cytosine(1402)-N(4))-methyltransferase RsmH [Nitrospirota bacterium]